MAKEKYSSVLESKYIKVSDGFILENGIFISNEESVLPKDAISPIVKRRKADYDYKYALTTGFKRKKRGKGLTIEALPEQEKAVISMLSEEQIVVPLLLIVAVIAVALSLYFSYCHQIKYFAPVTSILFALTIVLFNTIALSVITLFMRKKGFMNKVIALVSVVFWIPCMVYSMTNMLDVVYDKTIAKTASSASSLETTNTGVYELSILQSKIDITEEKITSQEELIASLDKDLLRYIELEWSNRSVEATTNRNLAIKEKQRLQDVKSELLDNKLRVVSTNKELSTVTETVGVKTIYTEISDLIEVDSGRIELLVTLLPALFFDLIAPFVMAMALYLIQERKNEHEKSKDC